MSVVFLLLRFLFLGAPAFASNELSPWQRFECAGAAEGWKFTGDLSAAVEGALGVQKSGKMRRQSLIEDLPQHISDLWREQLTRLEKSTADWSADTDIQRPHDLTALPPPKFDQDLRTLVESMEIDPDYIFMFSIFVLNQLQRQNLDLGTRGASIIDFVTVLYSRLLLNIARLDPAGFLWNVPQGTFAGIRSILIDESLSDRERQLSIRYATNNIAERLSLDPLVRRVVVDDKFPAAFFYPLNRPSTVYERNSLIGLPAVFQPMTVPQFPYDFSPHPLTSAERARYIKALNRDMKAIVNSVRVFQPFSIEFGHEISEEGWEKLTQNYFAIQLRYQRLRAGSATAEERIVIDLIFASTYVFPGASDGPLEGALAQGPEGIADLIRRLLDEAANPYIVRAVVDQARSETGFDFITKEWLHPTVEKCIKAMLVP